MGLKLGMNAKIYRNTGTYESPVWVVLDNVNDVTLNLDKETTDVSTRGGNGWAATAGTLKDGSTDFSMIWNAADAGFTAIKDAFFADEPPESQIEMLVLDGAVDATGSMGLRAFYEVISFQRTEALREAIKASVNIKPGYNDNPPEWVTMPLI